MVEGHGLKAVMKIPGVEAKSSKSNHILEIEGVLGIEAAHNTIIHEISSVMQSHSISIDIRHINLLAEIMTSRGNITYYFSCFKYIFFWYMYVVI